MPGLFDQALISIQSPRNVPIVGVLSQDMIGRKKVFFTSLIRDSVVKPCDYPLLILSPEVDLLRSIKVTTLENFRAKEGIKICNFFPATLQGAKYKISSQELAEKMYVSLVYTRYNKLVEIVELESMDVGCAIALLPRNSPRLMSEHDRLFAAAGDSIGTSFFAQDIEHWCKTVDKWSVTQLTEDIWLANNEAFESMVLSMMETHMRGFAWRFLAWAKVKIADRMAKFFSTLEDPTDLMTQYLPNGEDPIEYWRRLIIGPFHDRYPLRINEPRSESSVISFSTNDSYTQMSPPFLNRSEQDVLDTSLETAQSEILYLRARLSSSQRLVKDLHEERRNHMQMLSDFSNIQEANPIVRTIMVDTEKEKNEVMDNEAIVTAPSTSYAKVTDNLRKDILIFNQEETTRKRKRSPSLEAQPGSNQSPRLDVRDRLGPARITPPAPNAPPPPPTTTTMVKPTMLDSTITLDSSLSSSPTLPTHQKAPAPSQNKEDMKSKKNPTVIGILDSSSSSSSSESKNLEEKSMPIIIDRSPIETRKRKTSRALLPAFNASVKKDANLEAPTPSTSKDQGKELSVVNTSRNQVEQG